MGVGEGRGCVSIALILVCKAGWWVGGGQAVSHFRPIRIISTSAAGISYRYHQLIEILCNRHLYISRKVIYIKEKQYEKTKQKI